MSRAALEELRRRPTLPHGYPSSTIGAGGLNDSVRNGKRCGPSAIATGNRNLKRQRTGKSGRRPSADNSNKNLDQASRLISTSRLNGLHHLHLWPIDLVVFKEPSGGLPHGRSHLGVGFALRCFQRLSHRDIATQRCPWRDNWYTRGLSIPVLSY